MDRFIILLMNFGRTKHLFLGSILKLCKIREKLFNLTEIKKKIDRSKFQVFD